jgi:hypothetical protein
LASNTASRSQAGAPARHRARPLCDFHNLNSSSVYQP